MDTNADTMANNIIEGMKMEIGNKQMMNNDFSATLSDETHQHLTISERPSNSCRKVKVRTRPRLQLAKSFPPYSQCIGGLGDDGDGDNPELDSEKSNPHQQHLGNNEDMQENRDEVTQAIKKREDRGTEREVDGDVTSKCARDELKAKWRVRRKEKSGGSWEADTERCERGRWSGKRRVEETGEEGERDNKGGDGGSSAEWKHWRSFETERQEEGAEERERAVSEKEGSVDTLEGKGEEPEELREASLTQQKSSPHPIFSKLLHSSSSTSSCSSINLSSAESDEVFSEGEDAGKKRKAFRKVRKPKTTRIDEI